MKNKYFAHFVIWVLDVCFHYLHKRFDVYYDFESECYSISERGVLSEE